MRLFQPSHPLMGRISVVVTLMDAFFKCCILCECWWKRAILCYCVCIQQSSRVLAACIINLHWSPETAIPLQGQREKYILQSLHTVLIYDSCTDIIHCMKGGRGREATCMFYMLSCACFVLFVGYRNSMHGKPMVYLSVIICGAEPRGSTRLWIKLRWWDLSCLQMGFHREHAGSFCLQIQYLNPHQCNTRLPQATDSPSDSVCVHITHL